MDAGRGTALRHVRASPSPRPCRFLLDEYPLEDDRELLGGVCRDRGLRRVAARGWTTPDGTRTRICLLQFHTGLVAGEVQQAYLLAGDVIGLVVQSRKGGARAVPFQQTVALQEELLG
ncbi:MULTISPECIES: hypothetical protein [Streptomyces]|uniref:Uncharacterized protein n=1 Tax=Streptomyces griseofuscus TaxID=146922 RepID=A0A7H1Q299_9ACTN|nr:hypothetical protein [Streptomyces murinus]MBA9046665.1 hypothetical protein [Streptomyces murinus]QNT94429.1 hypothetical protein HEP81_04150 [Streptomyces griseofuscus]